MMNNMNQKGAIAIIYIIAAVVIVLAVIAVAFQFGFNGRKPTPSPTSSSQAEIPKTFQSQGCKDMDYTGCDGPEWATWTDDRKR